MKGFMRRDHADFLVRQFMGMELGDDIMRGLYNREALSHKAFSRHDARQNLPAANDAICSDRMHLEKMDT